MYFISLQSKFLSLSRQTRLRPLVSSEKASLGPLQRYRLLHDVLPAIWWCNEETLKKIDNDLVKKAQKPTPTLTLVYGLPN